MQSPCSSAPFTATRIPVPPHPCPGNAGIRCRYPIDAAAWIWAPPPKTEPEIQLVTFQLEFTLEEDRTICFDVSADQRYLLRANGLEFGRGPDRAEAGGWSFHRYELRLTAGTHRLAANCWWLAPELAPQAQVSLRPGFALAGVDEASSLLNTGSAPWKVQTHHGISARPKNHNLSYHVIGCGFRLGAERGTGPWQEPVVVYQGRDDIHGIMHAPWRCEPSPLPEQDRTLFQGGRIRGNESSDRYQALCSGKPVRIPAHSTVELFWDFEDYVCGYTRAHLRGGRGAVLSLEWAESLYESPEPGAPAPPWRTVLPGNGSGLHRQKRIAGTPARLAFCRLGSRPLLAAWRARRRNRQAHRARRPPPPPRPPGRRRTGGNLRRSPARGAVAHTGPVRLYANRIRILVQHPQPLFR